MIGSGRTLYLVNLKILAPARPRTNTLPRSRRKKRRIDKEVLDQDCDRQFHPVPILCHPSPILAFLLLIMLALMVLALLMALSRLAALTRLLEDCRIKALCLTALTHLLMALMHRLTAHIPRILLSLGIPLKTNLLIHPILVQNPIPRRDLRRLAHPALLRLLQDIGILLLLLLHILLLLVVNQPRELMVHRAEANHDPQDTRKATLRLEQVIQLPQATNPLLLLLRQCPHRTVRMDQRHLTMDKRRLQALLRHHHHLARMESRLIPRLLRVMAPLIRDIPLPNPIISILMLIMVLTAIVPACHRINNLYNLPMRRLALKPLRRTPLPALLPPPPPMALITPRLKALVTSTTLTIPTSGTRWMNQCKQRAQAMDQRNEAAPFLPPHLASSNLYYFYSTPSPFNLIAFIGLNSMFNSLAYAKTLNQLVSKPSEVLV